MSDIANLTGTPDSQDLDADIPLSRKEDQVIPHFLGPRDGKPSETSEARDGEREPHYENSSLGSDLYH